MRVTVCDVGPRDGLQNEPAVLEPAVRAELVDRLAAADVPAVEAGAVALDALIDVSAWLEGGLVRELPGQLYRAGSFAPAAG